MKYQYAACTRALALAVLASLIIGCAHTAAPTVPAATIKQSPNDPRKYHHFELENGLKVLLISQPGADKAAASLAVFRGSNEDPPERKGLAHFVEHMLFLGTDAYPDVDAYGTYISTHGGNRNAYVASDHANYFFDIQPEYLDGALDRFAPFFISPRFDAAYVEREKNAVHSEYQMQLRNDSWRGFAATKAVMNPAHPGSQFNIGSLETLQGVTRDELIDFFQQHYSARNMALVVLGSQSLDELEAMVVPRFSAISGHEPAPAAPLPPAYLSETLPKMLSYRTLRDAEHVVFNFPVPPTDPYYDRQPIEYLTNLIGHEGPGSLHHALIERGWIESLGAGGRRMDQNNATVTVSMRLTTTGAEHVDAIAEALFAYLRLIEARGIERWRYEEQAALAELQFEFQELGSPLGFVYTLAPRFQVYPIADVVAAPYLMREFDERLIRRYLALLTPDNVMIERTGPSVPADQVEPWFEVPYKVQSVALDPGLESSLVAELALPEPNPFIPQNLNVTDAADAVPQRIVDEPGLALWLARDGSFDVPRATTNLRLELDQGLATEADVVHGFLYARLVEHELNADAYAARLAGLHYRVAPNHAGFQITLSGYSDRQSVLAQEVLDVFRTVPIDPARVAMYRDELARSWRDFRTERAYVQSHAGIRHLLLAGSYPPARLAARAAEVTPESLATWIETRMARVGVTALMHGNFERADAEVMADTLRRGLPLAATQRFEPDVLALHGRGPVSYQVDIADEDATMILYLQSRDESLAERAALGLSAHILSNPYFNELRTEQQLGYVVMATPTVLQRRGGISFIVQSPVAGAGDLLDITQTFLHAYREQLTAMPDAEFDAHKRGLISQLLEQDKTLSERSQRLWRDLELGFTDFDSRQQLAGLVAAIDRADYLAYYDGLLERLEGERLVVFSTGRFPGSLPTGLVINDPARLPRQQAPAETAAEPTATNGRSAG